jgi:hypothetical protein
MLRPIVDGMNRAEGERRGAYIWRVGVVFSGWAMVCKERRVSERECLSKRGLVYGRYRAARNTPPGGKSRKAHVRKNGSNRRVSEHVHAGDH